MTEEKRRAKRVKSPFYVKIGYSVAEQETKWEENAALNVSEYGLAIMTANNYPQNAILQLKLRIPTQPMREWTNADGKVIESSKVMEKLNMTRIDFVEPNPALKEALKTYVAWISKK